MAADTPYTRTLARAALTLGGEARLADALGVSLAELESWLRGEAVPPVAVFSAALDIVANGRPPGSEPV